MDPLADVFWAGQQAGSTDLSTVGDDYDVERGLRVQLDVLARWQTGGQTLGGWKVGLTSGRSRDAFGPGVRPFGYVLASRILRSSATSIPRLSIASVPNFGIETELCFRIGAPLRGESVDAAQARAAVAAVMPAFELNQKRLPPTASGGARTADNLSQWGIVIGPELRLGSVGDLDALVVSHRFGDTMEESVNAAGHIDDHFASLATLARTLARAGRSLEAGVHVITGAYSRADRVHVGKYSGEFAFTGSAGTARVAIEFTA